MEQSKYLMWTRTKLGDNYSWEEQAFAEDSSGRFGGCVWPPRSYSCSFCRREFRSAQALGGHMNVHRRDRARLKLSPNSQSDSASHILPKPPHHNDIPPSFSPLMVSAPNLERRSSFPLLKEFSSKRAGAEEYGEDADVDEQTGNRKRKRFFQEIPFILGSLAGDRRPFRSELLGVGQIPPEELDLELRLGASPLVK